MDMKTLLEYKCPCCGGSIKFDIKEQKMKCPFCDTEFETEALKSYDEALNREHSDSMEWQNTSESSWNDDEGVTVYTCNSCGGEIVCEETTSASACPYCGNPVIMTGRLSGDLKPDYVIPFKLDKKAAKEGLKKHLKGKHLLPKVFKDENHIDEIKGVYVPFWLFDTKADAGIRYKATRTRSYSDRNYIYTETSHYLLLREGSLDFENVPADGSSKLEDALMESIEPFDFSEAVDFKTAYLSGYLADRYDVSSDKCKELANSRIKNSIESAFAKTTFGYSSVITEKSSVGFSCGRVKYVLYPVWLLNTTYKNKSYHFAMNGQTGRFVGNLPLDKKAYFKWLSVWTAIFTAVTFGLLCLFML